MITWLCNVYPLTPHFYIHEVKLGYTGVYIFLAHLSRRLIGELIVYQSSHRLSVCESVCVCLLTLSNINTGELRYLEFQGNGENTSSFPKFEIANYDVTRIHVHEKCVHFRLELS